MFLSATALARADSFPVDKEKENRRAAAAPKTAVGQQSELPPAEAALPAMQEQTAPEQHIPTKAADNLELQAEDPEVVVPIGSDGLQLHCYVSHAPRIVQAAVGLRLKQWLSRPDLQQDPQQAAQQALVTGCQQAVGVAAGDVMHAGQGRTPAAGAQTAAVASSAAADGLGMADAAPAAAGGKPAATQQPRNQQVMLQG
ncbi:hypothetical protein COO60DRAFT_583049 [Scenedesmus sp. NREL 46B-D3]|nr:hypothetical protein COO60DRAFT_583049 [Scenedesmus sp. NREL 46B-D3]